MNLMTTIRDIIRSGVVTVPPDTTLEEAVGILTAHQIESAPVVAADGALVGMITEAALLDIVFDTTIRDACVSEYMTRDLLCIMPAESLSRAAQLFALHSLGRLPVIENGSFIGELSRRDLINYSLRSNVILTEPLMDILPELAQLS